MVEKDIVLNNKYLTLRLGSELLEMPNCCEAP